MVDALQMSSSSLASTSSSSSAESSQSSSINNESFLSVDSRNSDNASLSGSTVVEKPWTAEELYDRYAEQEDEIQAGCFGRTKRSFATTDRHGNLRQTGASVYGALSPPLLYGPQYTRSRTEGSCTIM